MKKSIFNKAALLAVLTASFTLTSCDKDDDMSSEVKQQGTITFENVVTPKDFVESGAFYGVGSAQVQAPVILPNQSVSFSFSAGKTQKLMFATMYGASKDWFFASEQPGLTLFDNSGNPVTGNVSAQVRLWDNGSKDNSTGAAESNNIAQVPNVDASMLMKLMLSYSDTTSKFTLTITNTSAGTANETPFSPGVWAVSNYNGSQLLNAMPFFTPNALTNPEITDIAQMGNVDKMVTKLNANTGIMTGISPALVVVYTGSTNPIYELGQKDKGLGLKEIAQYGNTSKLMTSLKALPNVKGVYMAGSAPVTPGQKVTATFEAAAGDKIAYATMFGFSNDWFYANDQDLTANDKADVTAKTALFDSGTGISQYPGAGNHQALFGGMPQTESLNIAKVGSMYPVPSVANVLKVTINQ